MKTIKIILSLFVITTLFFSCKNEAKAEIKTVEVANETVKKLDPDATYAKAEFTINGMTCAMGCAATIEKKIAKMDGVKSAKVDFDKKLAMVEYDNAKVTPASLEETVTKVADTYKIADMKTVTDFSINKKTCSAKCSTDCTKKDCTDCKAKTEACKAKCTNKTDAEKKACAADSKKACCIKKAA